MPLSLGSLTDYNIAQHETTLAQVKWVGPAANVNCIINNHAFPMVDIGAGIYQATLTGWNIGVCAAAAIKFIAGEATVPSGDVLTIAGTMTVTAGTNYDIATIETAIVAFLSLSVPALKTVLSYEPDMLPELPSVTLWFDGIDQSQTEAVSYTVNYKWKMILCVRLLDAKIAQDEVKALTRSILNAFKVNLNFSGTVLKGIIPSAVHTAVRDKNNPVLVVEFSITAMIEED